MQSLVRCLRTNRGPFRLGFICISENAQLEWKHKKKESVRLTVQVRVGIELYWYVCVFLREYLHNRLLIKYEKLRSRVRTAPTIRVLAERNDDR